MSLTSHLNTPGGTVRAWFEERLGHTRGVVRTTNLQLRGPAVPPRVDPGHPMVISIPTARTVPSFPTQTSDAGLVGHAADWLLRLCLVDHLPSEFSAAGLGASRVRSRQDRSLGSDVFDAAVERISALRPATRSLSDDEWEGLCQLCIVLGWLERCYRAGIYGVTELLGRIGDARGLDAWIQPLVGDDELDDLALLGWGALQDHSDLRPASIIEPNPSFDQSVALGGADADLLADGLLLDFKSTGTVRIVSRKDIWQLVGYALADTSDTYEIRSVAISALRWRTRATWRLPELLGALAGEPVAVAELRGEFAALLTIDTPHLQRRSTRKIEPSQTSMSQRATDGRNVLEVHPEQLRRVRGDERAGRPSGK